jgi:hypothetical protein
MNNWELYRTKCSETAKELSWYNRSKELINLYNKHAE